MGVIVAVGVTVGVGVIVAVFVIVGVTVGEFVGVVVGVEDLAGRTAAVRKEDGRSVRHAASAQWQDARAPRRESRCRCGRGARVGIEMMTALSVATSGNTTWVI